MATKMSARSLWLLRYLANKPIVETANGHVQLGMARHHAVPVDGPAGIGMSTMRGLVRRGFVEERGGLFYVTEAGKIRAFRTESEG